MWSPHGGKEALAANQTLQDAAAGDQADPKREHKVHDKCKPIDYKDGDWQRKIAHAKPL